MFYFCHKVLDIYWIFVGDINDILLREIVIENVYIIVINFYYYEIGDALCQGKRILKES